MTDNKLKTASVSYQSKGIPIIIGSLLRLIIKERPDALEKIPSLPIFTINVDADILSKIQDPNENDSIHATLTVKTLNQGDQTQSAGSKRNKNPGREQKIFFKIDHPACDTPSEQRYILDILLRHNDYPTRLKDFIQPLFESDSRILSLLSTARDQPDIAGQIYTAHLWWMMLFPHRLLEELRIFYETPEN